MLMKNNIWTDKIRPHGYIAKQKKLINQLTFAEKNAIIQ